MVHLKVATQQEHLQHACAQTLLFFASQANGSPVLLIALPCCHDSHMQHHHIPHTLLLPLLLLSHSRRQCCKTAAST
jgi:hypothetical protein